MNKESFLKTISLGRLLKDKIARHPEWEDEILANLERRIARPELNSTLARMTDESPDEAAFMRAIRRFKYKNLIRIAVADSHSLRGVPQILAEWSDVADSIISAAYDYAWKTLSAKTGSPSACTGAVIALGKLGGAELNISSDVDLIFVYASDEDVSSISNHEFYVHIASLMTRLLSTNTKDGFAYRVDHDLRPEGPAGTLANSLEAMLRYYECFGRDWERQAFIRARAIAGDIALGEKLISEMRPFVYRRSLAVADISHMREMKKRMEQESFGAGKLRDIKHGPGGIREAEFLVQALMSLHGGANPAVRSTNTFEAIDALERHSLIHPHGAKLLKEAYSFLRRLENMIQIADDIQTHRIPSDPSSLHELAQRMGYQEEKLLEAGILNQTRVVQILFHALFEEDYDRKELEEALAENLSSASNEEEEADSLAWFVKGEMMRLARLDLEGKIELLRLLERLTTTADVALGFAFKMSAKRLEAKFGAPSFEGKSPEGFAIIGMGKLGSSEIDYGSDLDICFLYSGEGETRGPVRISNVEYFTKLAQRIISIISLPTRYGRAYAVDSELRPSGGQGALVATLGSFINYHGSQSTIWERLSLLKARVIAGDKHFAGEAEKALSELTVKRPAPEPNETMLEIGRLRERSLAQRAKESSQKLNIKLGRGGVCDLESVIQYHHILNIHRHKTLRKQNTFEVLDALLFANIIDSNLHDTIMSSLTFYRTLLSRIRLVTASSTDLIDTRSPALADIAAQMGYKTPAELLSAIAKTRIDVEEIYNKAFRTEILSKQTHS